MGLSGAAIARKGVEKMAVVLNLVAVRCLHYSQFPWQRGRAGWGTGACCQQWWPGLGAPAGARGGSRCIGREVIQRFARRGIGQDGY